VSKNKIQREMSVKCSTNMSCTVCPRTDPPVVVAEYGQAAHPSAAARDAGVQEKEEGGAD
jgi:hypothetical protein